MVGLRSSMIRSKPDETVWRASGLRWTLTRLSIWLFSCSAQMIWKITWASMPPMRPGASRAWSKRYQVAPLGQRGPLRKFWSSLLQRLVLIRHRWAFSFKGLRRNPGHFHGFSLKSLRTRDAIFWKRLGSSAQVQLTAFTWTKGGHACLAKAIAKTLVDMVR